MIELLLNMGLVICLAIIVLQDIKYRAIHVGVLAGVLLISCLLFFIKDHLIYDALKSFLFVSFVLILLGLYLSIKNKRLINPLSKDIGLGDILFFYIVIPLFSFHNYILFFIAGMFFSIIVTVLFLKEQSQIPLAGLLAILLIILLSFSSLSERDFLYNNIIPFNI